MKVDVCINVYGKPWQTLCTIKSLFKHSSNHIDKIFIIKEPQNLFGDDLDWIFTSFPEINLEVYTPSKYRFCDTKINYKNNNDRLAVRYQYAFESSNKKFLFTSHNDILFTGDIIGEMLTLVKDNAGIGPLGQCWNCPASKANLCDSDRFYTWNPTYEEVMSLPLPHVRTNINNINKEFPKPLPECRLNEWASLINREYYIKETWPNGDVPLFGEMKLDTADGWFRYMHLKGYKFLNYNKNFIHHFWSNKLKMNKNISSKSLPLSSITGYDVQKDLLLYKKSEEFARIYYTENFVQV